MSSQQATAYQLADILLARSMIVDDLLDRNDCPSKNVLYFYCDYADPPSLNPANVYRALLQQMFLRGLMSEDTVKRVVETLRTNVHGLSEQKLLGLLSSAVRSCAGLHLVIDGLDECESNGCEAVIDALCRWMTIEHSFLKVLVTCRDEGHLLMKLNKFERLHISSRASAADIQSYVSHAITSRLSSGDLTLRNPTLKRDIIAILSDKAQGMYV